jgi:hypothetical protein
LKSKKSVSGGINMREKILEMEAGRELDSLVAEDVMGWKMAIATDGTTEYWDNGTFCGGKRVEPVTGGFRLDDYSNTWNPSTNISNAWEVLEKMRERFDWVGIDSVMKSRYRCLIIDRIVLDGKETIGECIADTAPEAICKAALLAAIES